MQRQTTTLQIQNAIKSNHLHLLSAEVYNKNTRKTEVITNENFLESFDFLCESEFFVNAIGWHYEKNNKTDDYEIECSRMDGNSDVIITAYFRKNDGVTDQDIKDSLLKNEEEE